MSPQSGIRDATVDDDEAIVELWNRCGLLRPWNDPVKDLERNRKDGVTLLVHETDGAITGAVMVGYDGHRGWVNYLAADPDQRGAGIGRALMTEAERRLLAAGCPKLNLQIRLGNDDVIAFYKALGYEIDAAVSMGKRLIPDE